MRLLNTSNLRFKEFSHLDVEPYAILSHCWNHAPGHEEPNYQQVLNGSRKDESLGWRKVLECCRIARLRKLTWAWVDTVCIDRTSSSELSESINCMFSWYQNSAECYVFLDDVPTNRDIGENWRGLHNSFTSGHMPSFSLSRWFSRGWTLQELLAPSAVYFYDRFGNMIGTRTDLARTISYATGIHPLYLDHTWDIQHASIAQRMSWTSRRRVTRIEDIAYSLLGIFDVTMPLLYGEGEKAFLRLQLAIIEYSDDGSIFAWAIDQRNTLPLGILAPSPILFSGSEGIVSIPSAICTHESPIQASTKVITYRYTARTLELLRGVVGWKSDEYKLVTLACKVKSLRQSHHLRLRLRRNLDDGKYYRVGMYKHEPNLLVDFLCHLIAYDKVIYVSSSSPHQMPRGVSKEDQGILSARRANHSWR